MGRNEGVHRETLQYSSFLRNLKTCSAISYSRPRLKQKRGLEPGKTRTLHTTLARGLKVGRQIFLPSYLSRQLFNAQRYRWAKIHQKALQESKYLKLTELDELQSPTGKKFCKRQRRKKKP